MSGAEHLDTPTTPYAYIETRDGWNKKTLTVYCWSHESKRWGYCIDPRQFSDWRWKDAKFHLPTEAKTFEFHRSLSPYDAAVKMEMR